MTELAAPADLERVVNLADFEPLARERMAGPGVRLRGGRRVGRDHARARASRPGAGTGSSRACCATSARSTLSGTFLGRRDARCPIAIAPMAVQGMAHPGRRGRDARRRRGSRDPVLPLDHRPRCALEDVAAAAPDAERWFQLYIVGGMALQPRARASAPRQPATGRSS